MKILVIDPSATMRRLIVKQLHSAGFDDTIQAANGEEGLHNLEGVDLILTEWKMPVMDGLTMVKVIRADVTYRDIPIITITSQAAKREVVAALRSGVND